MKLKGIILDVDGTIADTEEIHRQAYNQTFKEFDLSWHWSIADYHQILSISGGRERFRKCLKEDKELNSKIDDAGLFIQKLHQRKSENYRSILAGDDTELRPGIKRLITEAQDKKIQLGVATSSSSANLKTLINKTMDVEPEDLFTTIVSSDIVSDKKPSPIVYQCALAGIGLTADKCIAIEDTYNGNQAALHADLKTVISTHRYTIDDDFTGASIVVNHLGEPEQPFIIANNYNSNKTYVDIELLNDVLENDEQVPLVYNELPDIASGLN